MTTLNERQRDALARGLARWYRGRLIPIMRGAEETPEEKTAREAAEATAAAEAAKDKKFDQAEVDRIVQERLARDRKDRPSDEELKTLREKAAKADELDAANKSELDKEREARLRAETERTAALDEAKKIKLDSQLLSEIAKADRKIVDPEGAMALLDRAQLDIDATGNATNVAGVVDKLLEAKPYLVAAAGSGGSGADQGARPGGGADQISRESLASMSPAEIEKAMADGRLTGVLGGS